MIIVEQKTGTVAKKFSHLMNEARNPETTPERLDELSKDVGKGIRTHIVNNPATSEETLRYLSTDTHSTVIDGILRNQKTPVDIILRFACREHGTDDNDAWDIIALEHPSLTAQILFEFTQSDEDIVLTSVIGNENCNEMIVNTIFSRIINRNNTQFGSYERTEILQQLVKSPHMNKKNMFTVLEIINEPTIIKQNRPSPYSIHVDEPVFTKNVIYSIRHIFKRLRKMGEFEGWPDEWVEAQYGIKFTNTECHP